MSSLSYDNTICDSGSAFIHKASSLLSFGSFAMHASGGHEETSSLDTLGMSCLVVTLLKEMMRKTETPYELVIYGETYSFDTLADSCAEGLASSMLDCGVEDGSLVQDI